MYKESQELKNLTEELKKNNLSRRDAPSFETVDWYVKTLFTKEANQMSENELNLRIHIQELFKTWAKNLDKRWLLDMYSILSYYENERNP